MHGPITSQQLAVLPFLLIVFAQAGCEMSDGDRAAGNSNSPSNAYFEAFTRVTADQAKDKRYKPIAKMEAQPKSATEEALQAMERQIGQPLPAEYRQFLQEYNGVSFPYPNVEFALPNSRGDEDFGRIEQVFAVDGYVNVTESQDDYEFRQRVPPGIICISEWNGYFRVCICVTGQERGAIYWWEPGVPWESDEETVPTRNYLTKVANNFREFWEMLRPAKP